MHSLSHRNTVRGPIALAMACAALYTCGATAGTVDPFSNNQPSLVLNKILLDSGYYPNPGSGGSDAATIGFIYNYGGVTAPGGSVFARGQTQATADNMSLASIVGTRYGGNGTTTFNLPDFTGRLSVGAGTGPGLPTTAVGDRNGSSTVTLGGSTTFDNRQPSLSVTSLISVTGSIPLRSSPSGVTFLGEIADFAGDIVPGGWLPADGRLLNIATNAALFSVLGTTYGGNGFTNFALPDLRGRTAVGADAAHPVGTAYGEATTTVSAAQLPPGGSAVDDHQPSLAISYLIPTTGIYNFIFGDEPTLGQVLAFAGTYTPYGYVAANGQLLDDASNPFLFNVFGCTYGCFGNQFAVPDLTGRGIVGAGDDFVLGTAFGTNQVVLTGAADTGGSPGGGGTTGTPGSVPEPGTWACMMLGLGLLGWTRRASRET